MKFGTVRRDFSCRYCKPPKRCLGCHDTCPVYKAEKEEYEARKTEAYKQCDYDRMIRKIIARRYVLTTHKKLGQI